MAAGSETVQARLDRLGIKLEEMAMPAGNYVPYVVSGNMVGDSIPSLFLVSIALLLQD